MFYIKSLKLIILCLNATRKKRVGSFFLPATKHLQYGSQVISPEHILLGLMREDKTISARFFPFRNALTVEAVRREVEERIVLRERIPQSAELHLAPETKRILAYANEESRASEKSPHRPRTSAARDLCARKIRSPRRFFFNTACGCRTCAKKLRGKAVFRIFIQSDSEKSKIPHLAGIYARFDGRSRGEGKLDPLIGREHGSRTHHRDSVPPDEKQSGFDRRSRRRQNGDYRRLGAKNRRQKRADVSGKQTHFVARSVADRRRNEISRAV